MTLIILKVIVIEYVLIFELLPISVCEHVLFKKKKLKGEIEIQRELHGAFWIKMPESILFQFNYDFCKTGKITLYDVKSHSLIMHLYSHTDVINDLKFTRDGSLQLMSASSDRTIKLWNIYQDGNMYHTFKGHTDKVNMCDWSPTAKMVVSAGLNRQAFIWDTNSFKLKHTLKGHLHNVSSCLFSPDGALVATSSYDTRILIWNPFSGVLVREFCHMLPPPRLIYAGGDNGAYIRDLSFSEAGDHVVSVCDDKWEF